MNLIFRYMKPYRKMIFLAILLKFLSTLFELLLPRILEHIIDDIVPLQQMSLVIRWGLFMFGTAILTWLFNISANTTAIRNSHNVSFDVRQDLFERTANLSGRQFDSFGLPSLISRMTSDSYNVQTGTQQLQSLCVRAPLMLIGGLCMMLSMDWHLSLVLILMLPFLIAIMIFVSMKGIPLFYNVQRRLDDIVRIMRENITGIRVVKALSKTSYEKKRYQEANEAMAQSDITASTVMAIPGPFMQLCLNIGLTIVVYIGARRVDSGLTQPGVILAFLTYFNMITMGVMGLTRIFISFSKASASANRIDAVIQTSTDQDILNEEQALKPQEDDFVRFEHVDFSYVSEDEYDKGNFIGGQRQNALEDISFSVKKGESLGIIGPTGCGKTTIINLLMRFYDATRGGVFIDGRDVRTYDKDTLHSMFGTVFQNDMIFQDTLRENIRFNRDISEEAMMEAAENAQAKEFINGLADGLDFKADIKGANLSGGQKQRIFVSRALAGDPKILILDDSSSALDYKTDALMRKAITDHFKDTTLIMIAQRISSVMNMTNIMVMDNGKCIGYGPHEHLLETCPPYKEIYDLQMGAMN